MWSVWPARERQTIAEKSWTIAATTHQHDICSSTSISVCMQLTRSTLLPENSWKSITIHNSHSTSYRIASAMCHNLTVCRHHSRSDVANSFLYLCVIQSTHSHFYYQPRPRALNARRSAIGASDGRRLSNGPTQFRSVRFTRGAQFRSVRFTRGAQFRSVRFTRGAQFRSVRSTRGPQAMRSDAFPCSGRRSGWPQTTVVHAHRLPLLWLTLTFTGHPLL